jgi:hypothetical protein
VNGPPWTNAEPINGDTGPRWMRWQMTLLGPGKSACVRYAVKVL